MNEPLFRGLNLWYKSVQSITSSLCNDNDNDNMFITIYNYIYTRYRMQDINTLKKSIKYQSFSDSMHGKGGIKPKLMDPNFCYTIENISFWGCRKQEMVQSERRMTSFILNLRSGVLLIHGQERVQTSTKQLTLIWDSISSSKFHYNININRFNGYFATTKVTLV